MHSNRCIVFGSTWTSPTTHLRSRRRQGHVREERVPSPTSPIPASISLVTEEVEVPGHDGTKIPLSIIHRKDTRSTARAPASSRATARTGSATRRSSTSKHSVARHGVVVAFAHVRGGSEKGQAWYKAGYKATKPNTWKDFISCWRVPRRQGLHEPRSSPAPGTSAGGILISRAITERPDLFAAAVVNVGVRKRAAGGVLGQRARQHAGVRHGARIRPRSWRWPRWTACRTSQAGVRYPAVLGVAGWNDPRVAAVAAGQVRRRRAAGEHVGRPVLHAGELRRRPLHRGEDGDVPELRRPVRLRALADRPQGVPRSGSTAGSRPRNFLKRAIASSVPPFSRTSLRKDAAVAGSKIPFSLKAAKASSSRTSAQM